MTGAGELAPRRKIAAGNWKMNGLLDAGDMLAELQGAMKTTKTAPNCDIIICPPFPYIHPFGQILAQTPPQISLGGQDCHPPPNGRTHGATYRQRLLADIGAKFVIIGHSERRANHAETDAIIAQKTQAAWRAGAVRDCFAWGKLWRNVQRRKPSLPASCKPACPTEQPLPILSSLTSRFGLSAQATRRTMMISRRCTGLSARLWQSDSAHPWRAGFACYTAGR